MPQTVNRPERSGLRWQMPPEAETLTNSGSKPDIGDGRFMLCPEMKALRLADRKAFSDRIYPPPPPVPGAEAPEAI